MHRSSYFMKWWYFIVFQVPHIIKVPVINALEKETGRMNVLIFDTEYERNKLPKLLYKHFYILFHSHSLKASCEIRSE